MKLENIQYVKPLINEISANEILTPRNRWWHFRKLALKRIELVFLPFYYFELHTESKISGIRQVNIVVDGITGVFSLFDPIKLTDSFPPHSLVFQFEITPQQASEICLNEYKRILLNYSLKQHVFVEVKEIMLEKKIFYPFWIGYLLIGKRYDFQAIDAVDGKVQGIKMRRAFLNAFNQEKTTITSTPKT